MLKLVVAYVPVIHAGYIKFFEKWIAEGYLPFVLGQDVLVTIDQELGYLRKEIRALTPEQARGGLRGIFSTSHVEIFDMEQVGISGDTRLVMPADDVSHVLMRMYLSALEDNVFFDGEVFLRWDRDNRKVNKEVECDEVVTELPEPMSRALFAANLSTDWWRRVGAVAEVADTRQTLITGFNHHLPSPYTLYIDGDPRNAAHRGEDLDLCTAIHAEQDIVAQAAMTGLSLHSASVYVTTFPCPTCANILASVGISRLYFAEGYAMLNGAEILRGAGVELVKVNVS